MKKIILYILAGLLAVFLAACAYFYTKFEPAQEFEWGVTFSHRYAEYLGLDWRQVYLDMLDDLQPKKLRLMAYWEDIEAVRGQYDFSVAAAMLDEAGRRNIDVILVVGHKQPRWPECHHPAWYNELSPDEKNEAQLTMVRNVVNYYKQFEAIKMWQVENEALFSFGYECPPTAKELVKAQMDIVRAADSRPILLTDSGEFGRWLPTASLEPDVFGSTMYRVVHNPKFGYFKYPLPPEFFRVKAGLFQSFYSIPIIGIELQAEPWFADDLFQTPLETHYALMNPKILAEYAQYARDAGFGTNYLWGVEWWYWLAQQHDDWGMWEAGKSVLAS